MIAPPDLPRLAQTVGDPTRARMLALLMDGRELIAKELALGAGVEPATATAHLARLARDGLVRGARRGRTKAFRLASPAAARMVEALMALTATPQAPPTDPLRAARFCYDHLAGQLGVAVTERLLAERHLAGRGDELVPTRRGEAWLADLGIDLAALRAGRRPLGLRCLDWSERRDHLAGALGAALAARLVELGWISRRRESRIVEVTPAGRRHLLPDGTIRR